MGRCTSALYKTFFVAILKVPGEIWETTYSLLLIPSPTRCHHWLRNLIQVKMNPQRKAVFLLDCSCRWFNVLFSPQRVEVRLRALWIQTLDVVTYCPQLLQIPSSPTNKGTWWTNCGYVISRQHIGNSMNNFYGTFWITASIRTSWRLI